MKPQIPLRNEQSMLNDLIND